MYVGNGERGRPWAMLHGAFRFSPTSCCQQVIFYRCVTCSHLSYWANHAGKTSVRFQVCTNFWSLEKCIDIYLHKILRLVYRFIFNYILSSGGPLSALTCCVNARLLSAIKKISPLIYSQSWLGAGSILCKLWWLSPWYFSADVYLAELHCRGRERVFELEARSPWWTDC